MPFADELFGTAQLSTLVDVLRGAAPDASWNEVAAAAGAFDGMALGARARTVADALVAQAPDIAAMTALVTSALDDDRFDGWMIWSVTEAIATVGTASGWPDDHDEGLRLLTLVTGRLTAEWGLRPFLVADLDRTLAAALAWTDHPDEHVRRLASEGTRLRLPWGRQIPALNAAPHRTVPIIDRLHRDPSETVRRSAANHLNDLSRADADLAVATAAGWLDPTDPESGRTVRHALRTLVKQAHPGALALLGFGGADTLEVDGPHLVGDHLRIGDDLAFTGSVTNTGPVAVRVAIDFVVHFQKADGTLAPKVFKLTTADLEPGESRAVAKRLSLHHRTTRRLHPGPHAVDLQVNGARSAPVPFTLDA